MRAGPNEPQRALKTFLVLGALAAVGGFSRMSHGETGWLPPISDGYVAQVCPFNNERLTGASCDGDWCDDIRQYCGVLPEGQSYSRFDWNTRWFSEEHGPNECFSADGRYAAITGMACRGAYCDDLKLECGTLNPGHELTGCEWTNWFSDEGSVTEILWNAPGEKSARAVQCAGDYCDRTRYFVCNQS